MVGSLRRFVPSAITSLFVLAGCAADAADAAIGQAAALNEEEAAAQAGCASKLSKLTSKDQRFLFCIAGGAFAESSHVRRFDLSTHATVDGPEVPYQTTLVPTMDPEVFVANNDSPPAPVLVLDTDLKVRRTLEREGHGGIFLSKDGSRAASFDRDVREDDGFLHVMSVLDDSLDRRVAIPKGPREGAGLVGFSMEGRYAGLTGPGADGLGVFYWLDLNDVGSSLQTAKLSYQAAIVETFDGQHVVAMSLRYNAVGALSDEDLQVPQNPGRSTIIGSVNVATRYAQVFPGPDLATKVNVVDTNTIEFRNSHCEDVRWTRGAGVKVLAKVPGSPCL